MKRAFLLMAFLIMMSCASKRELTVNQYQYFIVDTVYQDSSFSILIKDNEPCAIEYTPMLFPSGSSMSPIEVEKYDHYVRIHIKQLGLIVSKNDTLFLIKERPTR